jgi:hypothetical protein
MVEHTKADSDQTDPPPTRRPWHAPEFYETEVASTYAQGACITDANPGNAT